MLINVTIGGITKYLENGVPYVEGGEQAIMDTSELTLKEYEMAPTDTTVGIKAVEYWDGDQLRHRSLYGTLLPIENMMAKQTAFG